MHIINEPYLLGEADGEIVLEAHAPLADDVVSVDDRLHELFVRLGESADYELTRRVEQNIREVAAAAIGLPVGIETYDADEVLARARHVSNIVAVDPNAPTLSEVRQMMDEADAGRRSDVVAQKLLRQCRNVGRLLR